jgi:hypothetical protein
MNPILSSDHTPTTRPDFAAKARELEGVDDHITPDATAKLKEAYLELATQQEKPTMPLGLLGLAAAANTDVIADAATTVLETVGDVAKAAMPEAAPPPLPTMREAAAHAAQPRQEQQQELGLEL